jgi:bacterioferritin
MSKQKFIDALNEDLASEYASIVQYIQHISSVKGARYQQALEEMKGHLQQEVTHATTLAQQIDFLGGTAGNSVPEIETRLEPRAALRQDLQLEERQLSRYRDRVAEANDLGLPDVAEALTPLLEQTQDHVRDLRAVLGL